MKVWVDCTAAAHPLVLRPIIERLQAAGHEVEVTAREYGQTTGILERLGIPYEAVGKHAGGSMVAKGGAVATRSRRLHKWARKQSFDLALAHGSVDIAVVTRGLRVPLVQMNDYEHAGLQRRISFRSSRLVLAPDAISVEAMERAGAKADRLFRYPGLKEDYYLFDFEPDPAVLDVLGIEHADGRAARHLVVLRPPPETSEYHRDNPMYEGLLDRLATEPDTVTVVIPRTEGQEEAARSRRSEALIVPDGEVDAQSLIALADLVVSAGGTMNREAVALGTGVYTIFSGEQGAVDARLIEQGRLRALDDPRELVIERRTAEPGVQEPRDPQLLADAVLSAAPSA